MNARRVHQLMLHHFPKERVVEWTYVCDCAGRDERQAVRDFLLAHIEADTLLVEVSRATGDLLPREEAIELVAANLCKAEIRVADRALQSFVLFARNGVAAAWRT